jgi:hypothetical protein
MGKVKLAQTRAAVSCTLQARHRTGEMAYAAQQRDNPAHRTRAEAAGGARSNIAPRADAPRQP